MRCPRVPRFLLTALALVICGNSPALAAWPNSPFTNLPICTSAYDQMDPTIVADGSGGVIITWSDDRNNVSFDIYAQHVLASGVVDPAWPAQGTALCTIGFNQANPVIVSDGAGGAIVAWEDIRSGSPSNVDLYAQHVRAGGTVDPAWTANGTALCTAAGNQLHPKIVSDGAGGALVTWDDLRSGNYDIYAQHVLGSGVVDPAWTALNGNANGTPLCTLANNQTFAYIVSDGAGGAIVAWEDSRSGTNADIYAQHVLASGAVDPTWTANGVALCTALSDQVGPVVVPDGAGGAIVAWEDLRNGNYDIFAQHLISNGLTDPNWSANGVSLCSSPGDQLYPAILSDGAGGAIVTWHDYRGGANSDIYAQHVLANGFVDPAWTLNGSLVCGATGSQLYPCIVSDGAGGAIITWQDLRDGLNYHIYAQHVRANGLADQTWPANGVAICSASGGQFSVASALRSLSNIVSDGAGGAIMTWFDIRNSANYDIYAQRVARFGYLGTPEPEIVEVKDVPNDNGGRVKLGWNATYLDLNSDPNMNAYYIYSSVPPNLAARAVEAGTRRVVTPGPSGAMSTDPEVITKDNVTGYLWQLTGSVTAQHYLPGYSFLAPTAEDSTGYGNPKTAFMVVAQNYSGSMYWPSRPDSGYSVDNLPPLPPAPFTGTFSAGIASLHWGPNSEPDLANYRLYRGTTSSFTPSPANRIAAPADTGYSDPAGATYWYKLSAVDIHGNESGFSTLLPAGALDVSGGAVPRELALERPSPNPASGPLTLRYALPRQIRITLAIYDAAGRTVRELVSGIEPAGEHALTWDRRDDAGHRLGAGLYFIRLDAEGRTLSQRFATLN